MSKVIIDPAGLAAVCNQPAAVAAQREAAVALVDHAHQTGHKAAHGGRHIVDLIAVGDTAVTSKGAVTAILWPSPFWHFIEFGTQHQTADRTITRSAQHVGLRVVEGDGG